MLITFWQSIDSYANSKNGDLLGKVISFPEDPDELQQKKIFVSSLKSPSGNSPLLEFLLSLFSSSQMTKPSSRPEGQSKPFL